MTAYPSSTAISAGTLRAGDYTRLQAADGNAYQVNASNGWVTWTARITGVPNTLTSLQVGLTASSSAPCTQTLSLFNTRTALWTVLDSHVAGTTPVTSTVNVSGTLADYVSNLTGNGDVLVRVRCSANTTSPYFMSADQLRIVYTP